MANTYKNIVITPNIGNTADPKIQFSGGNTTVNTDISLFVYPSSNGTLSFEGSAGQLFSVTNDLSGSLFSVNDVSGIPSLEVFANGLVSVAPLGGNVVFGNTSELILSPGTGLYANASLGTAGHVLHSNGSSVYWAADDDTNTTYDLLHIANTVANEGRIRLKDINNSNDDVVIVGAGGVTVSSNSTAVLVTSVIGDITSVTAGDGLTGGGSTGDVTLNVGAGTGITVSADAVAVNAAYIATITANNSTFMNGNTVITVMENLRANRNISGGGTITVDGSGYVLWSQRFIVISNGKGAHFGTAGYFDITCPTSGTITGVGSAINKTATAAGIPLADWEALYYILPIGSAQGSVAANFRVASYTADLEIPSDWILICLKNGELGSFYFNNGISLKANQSYNSLTWSSSIAPYANNSGNLNGKTEANLNVNNATTAYGKTEGNLNVNAAAQLTTTRTINGVNFNGTANILVPSLYDANYRRITNPGGAEYTTTTATLSGALQIILPVGPTNTMMRMTVKIFEYDTNKSFDLICGGYFYNPGAGASWINTFAYILGDKDVDRRFTVRFGLNASSKGVIYVGELASTWSYPQVFVTEVELGYGGWAATWVSGWSIGFQASAFEGVTSTVTSTQVGYGTSTSTADALVLRDGSGNFSAGTITASLSGTATNSTQLGGVAAASYQLNSTLSANVATLTSNNATNAFGKTEGNLNVNNATTAYGKTEGNLNVNSAARFTTARTLTIGSTGKSFDGTAGLTWTTNEIGAEYQAPLGVPRVNLGDPTVREMALFDGQFTNKTELFNINNLFFETSTDNVTWTTYAVSDAQKRLFLTGDPLAGIDITNGTAYFRVRLKAVNYVYLNALYLYHTSGGHSVQVRVFRKAFGSTTWVQHTNSTVSTGSWPGHLYLPFNTIAWHPSAADDEIYFLFIPTWNNPTWSGTNFTLHKFQLWGGYPAGKRNIFTTSEYGDATFPANVAATSFSGALVLGSSNLSANGGLGTAGQVLHSNGTATYWAADDQGVTSVSGTGTVSGLTLTGTVTTTGSLTLGGTLSASVIDNMTDEHRLFNNMGDTHAQRTAFDPTTPSYNFGWRFIQGNTNGPNLNGAAQYYSTYVGLGNDYPATGAGSYGMQIAYPRNVTSPYISIRYNESNSLGAWQKISAGYADTSGTANNSTYAFGKTEGNLNVNNATTAYGKTEGNLNVNNAVTATSADQIDNVAFRNTGSNAGTAADTLDSNGITYYTSGVPNFTGNATDGALYSQAYSASWQHQIAGDYRSGQIALRGKNSGTWQAWRTVLDSSNYNSYAPTLTGTGASGTWGIGISGTANNATNAFGKTEGNLNVNNATTAATATNSTQLGGVAAASYQLNSTLSANVATLTSNNATNAFGKTEGNLNVNNATSAGGLLVHAGRNNEVNKIVRTDASGYIQAGWINTTSGDNGTTAITKVYASSDDYIRTYTPANFLTVLNVPTRSRAIAMSIIFG